MIRFGVLFVLRLGYCMNKKSLGIVCMFSYICYVCLLYFVPASFFECQFHNPIDSFVSRLDIAFDPDSPICSAPPTVSALKPHVCAPEQVVVKAGSPGRGHPLPPLEPLAPPAVWLNWQPPPPR